MCAKIQEDAHIFANFFTSARKVEAKNVAVCKRQAVSFLNLFRATRSTEQTFFSASHINCEKENALFLPCLWRKKAMNLLHIFFTVSSSHQVPYFAPFRLVWHICNWGAFSFISRRAAERGSTFIGSDTRFLSYSSRDFGILALWDFLSWPWLCLSNDSHYHMQPNPSLKSFWFSLLLLGIIGFCNQFESFLSRGLVCIASLEWMKSTVKRSDFTTFS